MVALSQNFIEILKQVRKNMLNMAETQNTKRKVHLAALRM